MRPAGSFGFDTFRIGVSSSHPHSRTATEKQCASAVMYRATVAGVGFRPRTVVLAASRSRASAIAVGGHVGKQALSEHPLPPEELRPLVRAAAPPLVRQHVANVAVDHVAECVALRLGNGTVPPGLHIGLGLLCPLLRVGLADERRRLRPVSLHADLCPIPRLAARIGALVDLGHYGLPDNMTDASFIMTYTENMRHRTRVGNERRIIKGRGRTASGWRSSTKGGRRWCTGCTKGGGVANSRHARCTVAASCTIITPLARKRVPSRVCEGTLTSVFTVVGAAGIEPATFCL